MTACVLSNVFCVAAVLSAKSSFRLLKNKYINRYERLTVDIISLNFRRWTMCACLFAGCMNPAFCLSIQCLSIDKIEPPDGARLEGVELVAIPLEVGFD